MPKLGLALSAAGGGPLRMPPGNLAPMGIPGGSGSGSGSGSSGAGIGEFLYSDGNILKMWLSDEAQVSGIPAMDTTTGNAILMWRDRSRNANVAQSYNHLANAPIAVPESVTVSGAVVSNPGGYELPVNGTYVRNGERFGKPRFIKSTNFGFLGIQYEKFRTPSESWFLVYYDNATAVNDVSFVTIAYSTSSLGVPSNLTYSVLTELWDGDNLYNSNIGSENYNEIRNTTFSGAITTTWSPAHASFDGTQYLTIPNPLTGDSAEVFIVCKPDNVSPNGALIGNIGSASDPEVYSYNNVTNVIMGQFSLFRTSRSVLDTTAPVSIFNKWHLLGIRGGPNGYATAHNGSYGVGAGQGNFSFSRTTYGYKATVTGAVVEGGDYQLPINGDYAYAGTAFGRPKFEKSAGDGGVLRLFWTINGNRWEIVYVKDGELLTAYRSANSSSQTPNGIPLTAAVNFALSMPNSSISLGIYSGTLTITESQEGPYIGRSTQGAGAYFQGKIAEIMLYNRALTSSERTVVQNYLNQKYSLWV